MRDVSVKVSWIFQLALALSVLWASPSAAIDPTRSLAQMSHTSYARDEGLPGGVTAVTQAPDGYLLVGTHHGLYRFNGVRFEQLDQRRLLSPDIFSLATSVSGDVWVGYNNGGLTRMRAANMISYPAGAGGPMARPTIREAPNARALWAWANFTPWRYDGRQWREVPGPWVALSVQGGGIWSLEPGRDGTLWAKDGANVFYCRPGCARFEIASGYAGGVMGFARDRDGRVWTSDTRAPGRMYAMPDLTSIANGVVPQPDFGGQVSPLIHGRIFLDRDGTLWDINLQHGILRARSITQRRADPTVVDAFSTDNGLSSDVVTSFYEDREGTVWVATNRGIDRFRPLNVVIETQIPATASTFGYVAARVGDELVVYASTSEDNSSPFAARVGPLYRVGVDGRVEVVVREMELPNTLRPAADGGIWVGTPHGLFKLRSGAQVLDPVPTGLNGEDSGGVADVVETSAGLWVSTHDGIWRRTNGSWSRAIPSPEPSRAWQFIVNEPGGALWLAYGSRVARYEGGRLHEFSEAEGPNVGIVHTMRADEAGVLFGGELGLARYHEGVFHTLRSTRLPVLNSVTGVVESEGQTWVGAQSGVVRFQTQELERALANPSAQALRYELFDRRDGLVGDIEDGNSISTDLLGPGGRIWILTNRSVVWIDPHNIYRNGVPPPLAIGSLVANGRAYDTPGQVTLPAGASNLEIDYDALSFVEPSRVRFRYKLDGVDGGWVDPGSRRQAYYTRLDPGTYQFRVIAANDSGVWNGAGATLTFTVLPTFVQSIWFKLLAFIALCAFGYGLYTLRLRQATERLQRRFDIRIAERERIARELHDTLLQGFQGLLLRFQSIANLIPVADETRGSIEEALNRGDAVLAEGRQRVRELRSSPGADDLAQSLAQAASEIINGDAPSFQLTVEGAQCALHALVGEEALRIFEEALRNAVHHADANAIEALLVYGRREFRISVRDDGIGIADAVVKSGERAGHFGLIGMRERAERIGGRLEVNTREGGGTEVTLSMPARAAYKEMRLPFLSRWMPTRRAP